MPKSHSIELDELSNYFYLPINDVAKKLGVCTTVLKKICRKNGVQRWPHRKIKSLENMIKTLESIVPKTPEEAERLQKEIETLKTKRSFFMKNPSLLAKPNKKKDNSDSTVVDDDETGQTNPMMDLLREMNEDRSESNDGSVPWRTNPMLSELISSWKAQQVGNTQLVSKQPPLPQQQPVIQARPPTKIEIKEEPKNAAVPSTTAASHFVEVASPQPAFLKQEPGLLAPNFYHPIAEAPISKLQAQPPQYIPTGVPPHQAENHGRSTPAYNAAPAFPLPRLHPASLESPAKPPILEPMNFGHFGQNNNEQGFQRHVSLPSWFIEEKRELGLF